MEKIEYIDCSLVQTAGLVLVVATNCLAVASQSGAKQFFYCTVYYITLNSNCEAQRGSKKLKKLLKNELEVKNKA